MPFLYNGEVGRPTEKHARGYSVGGGRAVEKVQYVAVNLGPKSILADFAKCWCCF